MKIEQDGTNIDWMSSDSHILLNPRLSPDDYKQFCEAVTQKGKLKGHIWLATSGSSGHGPKLVALSKEAFLTSAQAANDHLQSTDKDIWLNVLPTFHVGGLSIYARAHLCGAQVVRSPLWKAWDVMAFYSQLQVSQATLCSLVPTQVFDLVERQLTAPAQLRGLIVGGGALPEELYHQARQLQWPVLPSYGMTECCSQIATASLESLKESGHPDLQILKHVEVKEGDDGLLCVRSSALLTGWIRVVSAGPVFEDPKKDGWYVTQDRGFVQSEFVRVYGRDEDQSKVGGELVQLSQLQSQLQDFLPKHQGQQETYLLFLPSQRLGSEVGLVSESLSLPEAEHAARAFNKNVMPFERIRQVYIVDDIPRSPLGKVQRQKLLTLLGF